MLGHHIIVELISPDSEIVHTEKMNIPWTIKPGEDESGLVYICGNLNYPKRFNGKTIVVRNDIEFHPESDADISMSFNPQQIKDMFQEYIKLIK